MSYAACLAGHSPIQLLAESPQNETSWDVWASLRDAYAHYAEPVSRRVPSVAERFAALAEEWRRETGALSSMSQIALHPSYQQIIGLGQAALPLILDELKCHPDHWFWALKAITGVDPVPAEDRGNLRKMTAAWLAWAEDSSLVW